MRVAIVLLLCLLAACKPPSASMDCSGQGRARGSYSGSSDGDLEFRHAVAWREAGGGLVAMFTDDDGLAAAMRASADPYNDAERAAKMMSALLVGFRFTSDGAFKERLTLGTSTSTGWSGADEGAATVDADECARGDARLDDGTRGFFAVPLLHPERKAADGAVEPGGSSGDSSGSGDTLDLYRDLHAQLMSSHPADALEALGFAPGAAAALAPDPRVVKSLERIRAQCPDSRTATLDEYGDVVGPSPAGTTPSFTGTIVIGHGIAGAALSNCYVMQRDGEQLEQCWPLSQDCAAVPVYVPSS
jgi:hypothetical protein